MADLSRAFSEIKSLPDHILQQELSHPSGAIPGWLALGEIHERKAMRATHGGTDPTKRKSMAEEYAGSVSPIFAGAGLQQQRPPPPPPQRAMPTQGIAGLAQQPQGYAEGGIVGLADGGPVSFDELFKKYPDMTVKEAVKRRQLEEAGVDAPSVEGVFSTAIGVPFRADTSEQEHGYNIFSDPSSFLSNFLLHTPLVAANRHLWNLRHPDEERLYANGGIVSLANGGNVSLRDYLYKRAPLYKIDPRVAERIVMGEGGFHETPIRSRSTRGQYREPSYGSFQMLIGGEGTGYNRGMGNDALAAGIDPRKAEDQYRAIDFGLRQASQGGWTPWFNTMNKLGYGRWEGINGRGGTSVDPETMVAAANADVAATAADTAGSVAAAEVAEEGGTGTSIDQYLQFAKLMGSKGGQPQAQPPAPVQAAQTEPIDASKYVQNRPFMERMRLRGIGYG